MRKIIPTPEVERSRYRGMMYAKKQRECYQLKEQLDNIEHGDFDDPEQVIRTVRDIAVRSEMLVMEMRELCEPK